MRYTIESDEDFDTVTSALATGGVRCYVEERDESLTIMRNAREVFPVFNAAQIDAAFRKILRGICP